MKDADILNGLAGDYKQRAYIEKQLYLQFEHFIKEGCRKFRLTYDDSFSAYSDALLSVIHNIVDKRFNNKCSLKTYLFQVFSNKCIDTFRKKNAAREKTNHSVAQPELLNHLPDNSKNIIEELTDKQKIKEIKRYLETITGKSKEILLLFEDGYTDEQIAEILEYKTHAVVKTTRLRCLNKVREKLRESLLVAG